MLAIANTRIEWVLGHPDMSNWLKQTLRSADGLDPIALQNDLEMLKHLIRPRTEAQIEIAMSRVDIDLARAQRLP